MFSSYFGQNKDVASPTAVKLTHLRRASEPGDVDLPFRGDVSGSISEPRLAPPPPPTTPENSRVLVTEATGYLQSHIVQQLLRAGYRVRAATPNLADKAVVKFLRSLCPDPRYPLDLVQADLDDTKSYTRAVEGMTHVIHAFSPLTEQEGKGGPVEIVRPAKDSVMCVLHAVYYKPTVRRLVLTSSCMTIDWSFKSHDAPRDESYWSRPEEQSLDEYVISMTEAEADAWDFVTRTLGTGRKITFELVVLNPAIIMGPPLYGANCKNTSVDIIKELLTGAMVRLPKLNYPIVDVRDCALAHVKILHLPAAKGKRHILCAGNLWLNDIANILNFVFGPQGYNVATRDASIWKMKLTSIFKPSVKKVIREEDIVRKYNNSKMEELLQIEPRNLRDTIVDMAYACIENGLLLKTPQYRGPGGAAEREAYQSLQLPSHDAVKKGFLCC